MCITARWVWEIISKREKRNKKELSDPQTVNRNLPLYTITAASYSLGYPTTELYLGMVIFGKDTSVTLRSHTGKNVMIFISQKHVF